MENLLALIFLGVLIFGFGRKPEPVKNRQVRFELSTGRHANLNLDFFPSELRTVDPPRTDSYGSWFRTLHSEYKPGMRTLYEAIAKETRLEQHDFDETVVRLVQQIPYDFIPERYHDRPTHDLFPPKLTLYEQYGDCDSKSLLLATLLTYKHPVLLLFGQRHALVAIPGKLRPGDHGFRLAGREWLLCETTQVSPIGRIAESVWRDIETGKYEALLLE